MSFTQREARRIIRKAVGRVPEGEEIRHLNIMPMMDMMTILLVAFIFQAAVSPTALMAQSVKLPQSMNEEPLPAGHPLTRLDNVVLAPHLGWTTDDGYRKFAESAADVLLAYLEGREVPRFKGH